MVGSDGHLCPLGSDGDGHMMSEFREVIEKHWEVMVSRIHGSKAQPNDGK